MIYELTYHRLAYLKTFGLCSLICFRNYSCLFYLARLPCRVISGISVTLIFTQLRSMVYLLLLDGSDACHLFLASDYWFWVELISALDQACGDVALIRLVADVHYIGM